VSFSFTFNQVTSTVCGIDALLDALRFVLYFAVKFTKAKKTRSVLASNGQQAVVEAGT
jgi:hypothetical protein